MKILLLTHIYPPAVDGGSRVIYKLGQYFKKNNQIVVLTSNCLSTDDFVNPDSPTISPNNSDTNIFWLPVYRLAYRPLKLISKLLFFSKYLSSLFSVFSKGPFFKITPFAKTLVKIIKYQPDLIICGPLPTTTIVYARFIKFCVFIITQKQLKILINASFHQTDLFFYQQILIDCLQCSDYIWTLSNFEQHFFVNNLKIKSSKIINVGNGLDKDFLINTNQITSSLPKQRLLYLGSFSVHKNIELLIDTFENLSLKLPELTLTLAGQKTLYFINISQKINRLPPGVKSKINLILNFPDDQLASVIDHSEILVMPSSQESFSLVCIEAMARKIPIITSDIPVLKELVQKTQAGLTFENGDKFDLATKIEFLLKHPKLRIKLGNNGYRYVKTNHTWDKIGDKICQKISCL